MYEFINGFNDNVSCRPFTDVDPDVSGIEISVNGNRIGSMIGFDLPDEDDDVAITNFENEVEDWIIENE